MTTGTVRYNLYDSAEHDCLFLGLFHQTPKRRIKEKRYQQKLLLLRRLRTFLRTEAAPRTSLNSTTYSRKFEFTHQNTSLSIQTANRRRGHLASEGVIGSLPPATITTNFETWSWQGCCHAVSGQFRDFDVTRVALLVKQGTFPIKSQHKPVAVSEVADD